jgi:diguanylate cyclase (GGDEF)-like protein
MKWRRFTLLAASVLIVTVLAGITGWAQLSATRQARTVHLADRTQLEKLLAGLTGQYLQFTFLAANTEAQSNDWQLTPESTADTARLKAFASTSPLTSYGAALIGLTGQPLSYYPSVAALPSATDPGYGPMRLALIAGHPGLSSVMNVHGHSVVAFAVPVTHGNVPVAIFIAFADIHTWALQGYVQKLDIGSHAVAYTTDGQGVITAAADPSLVGTTLSAGAGVKSLLAGHAGTTTFTPQGSHSSPMLATFAPVGVGGWGVMTVQPRDAFYGSLSSNSDRVVFALVVLLAMVVILLVVLNHRRHRLAQELAEQRLYDPLTGLGQRVIFDLKLDGALARRRRTGAPVAVIYADLDSFKSVNDRLGHRAGDQLLTTVGNRLRAVARADDAVVRLGGDEFALVVEGLRGDALVGLVERIRAAVGVEVVLGSERINPRLSVGAAVLEPNGSPEDLVHAADLAMYRAKATGSGTHVTVLDTSNGMARTDHSASSVRPELSGLAQPGPRDVIGLSRDPSYDA